MSDLPFTDRLGPYRLQRMLGRGGMGTVYAAVEEATGVRAAIKVLSPSLAAVENFRERFGAEIESLKKLRHPNIVQLSGYGEQDGQLFYVMELIDGQNLQDELRRGRRFGWREVTRIAISTCAALKHAHDHGVIHRDLKPGNLLLTPDEQVKLCDFGIAKLFGSTTITTGSVMGTVDYMAPEQGEGKPVGPRTDLYSLGSVMYALMAGRPPFVGKTVAEVIHKVRFETPVPVGRLANDVPLELEQLIEQLLEKDPQKRVPTALAVSHRLKAMEHALSIRPVPGDPALEPAADSPDSLLVDQATAELTARHLSGEPAARVTITTDDPLTDKSEATHFTRVGHDSEPASPWLSWAALLRVALVLAVALAAWLLARKWMEPPTAEQLYAQITSLNDPENPRRLIDAEDQIAQFLQQYPQDPRREELLALQEEIELRRLQRRLESKARNRQLADSPLEEFYLLATRQMDLDPDLAAAQLEALIDLYGNQPQATPDQSRCIALARKQLHRLQQRIAQDTQRHRPLIEQRLAAAAVLEPTDPSQADQIYRGIIQLYGSRRWADDLVQQARQRLQQ